MSHKTPSRTARSKAAQAHSLEVLSSVTDSLCAPTTVVEHSLPSLHNPSQLTPGSHPWHLQTRAALGIKQDTRATAAMVPAAPWSLCRGRHCLVLSITGASGSCCTAEAGRHAVDLLPRIATVLACGAANPEVSSCTCCQLDAHLLLPMHGAALTCRLVLRSGEQLARRLPGFVSPSLHMAIPCALRPCYFPGTGHVAVRRRIDRPGLQLDTTPQTVSRSAAMRDHMGLLR